MKQGTEEDMLETDEYLKMAASNFKTAEAHFKDAEDSLYTLLRKWEDCLARVKKLKGDESLPCVQPDTFIYDSPPLDRKELHLVSR